MSPVPGIISNFFSNLSHLNEPVKRNEFVIDPLASARIGTSAVIFPVSLEVEAKETNVGTNINKSWYNIFTSFDGVRSIITFKIDMYDGEIPKFKDKIVFKILLSNGQTVYIKGSDLNETIKNRKSKYITYNLNVPKAFYQHKELVSVKSITLGYSDRTFLKKLW